MIPPAWQDVWICPEPEGHIQAVGTDAAGRRQYRFHDRWRAERDREQVLAAAIRLIELGFFRAGSEEYAADKDFRTWHATVLAAVGLAVSNAPTSETARRRAIVRVVREVADYLGNTPVVARASYIDPRIIDLYERGVTIEPALADLGRDSDVGELATRDRAEKAVLKILGKGARA